jgi:hypothetical protein
MEVTREKEDVCANCGESITDMIRLIANRDGTEIDTICTACSERLHLEGKMPCNACELPFIDGRVHWVEWPGSPGGPRMVLCTLCWKRQQAIPPSGLQRRAWRPEGWKDELYCSIRERVWRAAIALSAANPYNDCPKEVEQAARQIMSLLFETNHISHFGAYWDDVEKEASAVSRVGEVK